LIWFKNASNKKAKTENFITRFARYIIPLLWLYLQFYWRLRHRLYYRTLHTTVDKQGACIFGCYPVPCALVLSVPLSFFSGIGGASKNGDSYKREQLS
jgi:Cd2+/Zn2+-exporting ATPase